MNYHREIETTISHRTSDGRLFEDEGEARLHQRWLDFSAWCRSNICIGGEWSADMVAKEIWKNFSVAFEPNKEPKV